MIADYSVEIKIAIFQSVSERKGENENRRQIAAESRQKLCVLTVNSDIIGAATRSANPPLSNAKAKSKGRS